MNEWKTPIEFFGIVEDESNNPVADAKIDFECNDLSPQGTSFYQTLSDMNGAFSINNISGLLLRVTVSKSGYYSYQPNGAFFYYAGQKQNFVPDAGNPVVFYLREKGTGTNLIHYDKSFTLARDGTPILIDLPSGTVTPFSGNSLKVEGWTYDSQKKDGSKYDWKCAVSVPGGGLQTNDEQFPFLAPQSDYIPEDIINMPVTNDVPWSYIVHRNYYVHTADGKFGRMTFTMVAGGDNFCEINLYFNPSGSRNLEPSQ
ncbi:MAG TPA: carboxypeptidase-like regulatory domain-containing protein [Verrucomicrobiae bacterium]|nr:carboxypeptidase-like regulatory domain-containing protein [Verrucomicrobiae bacterium]